MPEGKEVEKVTYKHPNGTVYNWPLTWVKSPRGKEQIAKNKLELVTESKPKTSK